MQMALPCALRNVLLCFLAQALLAPGFVQSFLGIPDIQRVSTVANIKAGIVARPTPATAADTSSNSDADAAAVNAQDSGSTPAASSGGSTAAAPVAVRMWKVEAMFEMTTNAPIFTDEYASSREGVALTLADRLAWATGVPMSRFAFFLPDPGATVDASAVMFCESNNNEHTAGGWASRFSTAKNTTYRCEPQKHKMNSTTPVLLQRSIVSGKASSLSFEVGVYPASGVSGDTKPAVQVAEEMVEVANSGDEPERILHKNGLWTYMAGPGVKFHGLFPGSAASMPGSAFGKRDTSLPLGPNPGGHGAEPSPKPPPGAEAGANEKERNTYFAHVDTVVHEAKQINTAVGNSLQELKDSLARGSAVHAAWMTWNPYKPDPALIGP